MTAFQRLSHKSFTVSWWFLRSTIPVLIAAFLFAGTAQGVIASPHINAEGHQIRQQRDLLGQLLRQENPDGSMETLRWNALGLLPTQHINRTGGTKRREYTLRGQVIAHIDFEGSKRSAGDERSVIHHQTYVRATPPRVDKWRWCAMNLRMVEGASLLPSLRFVETRCHPTDDVRATLAINLCSWEMLAIALHAVQGSAAGGA
ncbi:hypothetical protein FACS1894185_6460 [Betaproteobacteria bacterium]|nr:hypothetical protein FACS1894185_6460 [Betaproteobacteria bacterium]